MPVIGTLTSGCWRPTPFLLTASGVGEPSRYVKAGTLWFEYSWAENQSESTAGVGG